MTIEETDSKEDSYDEHRPDLAEKMADEIDLAMTLADDPDYAEQIRGGK